MENLRVEVFVIQELSKVFLGMLEIIGDKSKHEPNL
jgi:hypothetical protein